MVVANTKKPIFNRRYKNQIFAACSVQIMTLAHGIAVGWLSPALQKLQSTETPLSFQVSVQEASWIGSLLGLGSILGNIIFGLLLDRIGRKWCLYLLAIPYMFLWVLIYFAQSVEYLYIARFLGGVTGGGNYVVMPIFVSEIADSNFRGTLSSMAMLFLSFGILIGFILSSHVPYNIIPCIIITLPVIYVLLALIFPETPQYLIKKGRYVAAEKSFKFYKNIKNAAHAAQAQLATIEVQTTTTTTTTIKTSPAATEFEELKANMLKAGDNYAITVKDFLNRNALQAFATALVLIALNQFSGSFALFNYTSHIFEASGTNMDANTCTIIVGVVQIVGTIVAMILVDCCGRKTLIITSGTGMALGMSAFGLFVHYATYEAREQYNWLPLVLMLFIVFSASIGVIALIIVIIVETMPMKIRPLATSISMVALSGMVFVALKLYPLMIFEYGIAFTMFACSTVCVITLIYLSIFLPETKNKSMEHEES